MYKKKKNGVIRDDEWSFGRTGMYQSRVHGHVPYFDQTELIQVTVNLLTRHHCLLLQQQQQQHQQQQQEQQEQQELQQRQQIPTVESGILGPDIVTKKRKKVQVGGTGRTDRKKRKMYEKRQHIIMQEMGGAVREEQTGDM